MTCSPETRSIILDPARRFSQSRIWQLQHAYFSERGKAAWMENEVPHYVTCNPHIANCFAELAFSLLEDQRVKPTEPLYICELGAGSGRFAFHFLRRLQALCEQAQQPMTAFKYILTDYVQSNIDAWCKHPQLAPYFKDGLADVALFDLGATTELHCQLAGTEVRAGSLAAPIMVIANYVFDSVPQDLYYLHEGSMEDGLLELTIALDDERPLESLSAAELLTRLQCHTSYAPCATLHTDEPDLHALLRSYQQTLQHTHLLFPAAALRCLHRLKRLSQTGMLLLSADKGDHDLASLDHLPAPEPQRHGSFSLQVNFHALTAWCEQAGGYALRPAPFPQHLGLCGLLMVPDVQRYRATKLAFQRHACDFSPDDFYTCSLHARETDSVLTTQEILAHLRLSYDDAHLLGLLLPRLFYLSSRFTPQEHAAILAMQERVWANYFPLGEEMDLAESMAYLFFLMNETQLALTYYLRSAQAYGSTPENLYSRALCHTQCGQQEEAQGLLRAVLLLEPEHAAARDLLLANVIEQAEAPASDT